MSANNVAANGVSVVTTTWNERENIEEVIRRIRAALQGAPHEIVVVDDSSSDGTFEAAKQLADTAVSKVREGQTKGLLYGAQLAKYPLIVTIDSDLENPPESIPAPLRKAKRLRFSCSFPNGSASNLRAACLPHFRKNVRCP
jgi:dolichol-phosphate mannosyltransferase